jgi:multidrug efflux pump subunit AcrB
MSHKSESELLAARHNTARYWVKTRAVAWVTLVATVVLGALGYRAMPKRKDPYIKARSAVAITAWPGASAEKVEELITRKIEEKVAQNAEIDKIESTSRTGVSVVNMTIRDDVPIREISKAFDDIDLKLRSIGDLPQGAQPIDFNKDFGDTAALMLTVASPKVNDVELGLRARDLARALAESRGGTRAERSAVILCFPTALNPLPLHRLANRFSAFATSTGVRQATVVTGAGFVAVDGEVVGGEARWRQLMRQFLDAYQHTSSFHPDVWAPFVVTDPGSSLERLRAVRGDRYSYRQLDDFTDAIARRLRGVDRVSKVTRSGVLGERIYLDYSQQRFAQFGVGVSTVREALAARNVESPSGALEAQGRNVAVDATGEYESEDEIGDTFLTTSSTGTPVFLRDLGEATRDYEEPPRYLNTHTWRDSTGDFQTSRAITLSIQMRTTEQVAAFSRAVEAALADVRGTLPEDLIFARTSDQAVQVEDKIGLFMRSLLEAIVLIVVVALIGFREWRSALVMALAIPLTLAMTLVFMWILGLDIQQMSIAALILALGLLIDDPVVAGDAIKREMDAGKDRVTAAWMGPTKLARAILYATVTSIVAYLPFLLMRGDVGHFIFALPVVITCALVASRLTSMTFIPLLGYLILRPSGKAALPSAFMERYREVIRWAIRRRYLVLALSGITLVAGLLAALHLRTSFFPKDLSYLSYVDIFLPEDSTIEATQAVAADAGRVILETAEDRGRQPGGKAQRKVLRSLSTFVGGGAPRFWYSLAPQQGAANYAQIVVEVYDSHETAEILPELQRQLSGRIPGAYIDVRQLENGKPVPYPIEVRITGDDLQTLRTIAAKTERAIRAVPIADRVRDDFGVASLRIHFDVDPVRAALAGVSNAEVAQTDLAALNGAPLNTLREHDKRIPIVARLRMEERGNLGDLDDLYVNSSRSAQKVPVALVATRRLGAVPEKIQRRNQLRTISVVAFPVPGKLPSEVMKQVHPRLEPIRSSLPPGYFLEIGGSEEEVGKVARDAGVVAVTSLLAIFFALVVQFRSAVKPLIVLAALPYGAAGAMAAIVLMDAPFGFTAILGTISLLGVIVSHIIVLFDYIEEAHERGESLQESLLDAGVVRLRPVLITVGATVLGLVPLALHGGPLWEALCYAQIGGLMLATAITLLLVPVLYAVFVLDLKWIKWAGLSRPAPEPSPSGGAQAILRPQEAH